MNSLRNDIYRGRFSGSQRSTRTKVRRNAAREPRIIFAIGPSEPCGIVKIPTFGPFVHSVNIDAGVFGAVGVDPLLSREVKFTLALPVSGICESGNYGVSI